MSPIVYRNIVYRDDGSLAWGTLAVVLVAVFVLLLVGYFAWFLPSQQVAPQTTIINTTPREPGTPGPAGAPGVTGAPGTMGAPGATGATGTTAPGPAGAPGATGATGKTGNTGASGTNAPPY